MENDFFDVCVKVCDVARQTGDFIAQQRNSFTPDKIEYKGEQNLVSYVDKQAEAIIMGRLAEIVVGGKFIAEESGGEWSVGDGDLTWVIDPLDGTTNFVHGLPPYAISIALMLGSEVVVGVIYEITCGECFYAWRGSDCYLNGKKIRVSTIDNIENSLVLTGLAYNKDSVIEGFRRSFDYFNLHSNGARRLGSAATDLAYVAAGRAECFYHVGLSPWDVAAGAFLVERAGGVVSDLRGGGDYIFGREVVATNGRGYELFFEKLKELL